MTASEFAFLALGLVFGVASGAALIVILRSRPGSREVRLTVSHDAVPKRGSTLSSDAFVTVPAEPARGGPADRRLVDRDAPAEDPPPGISPIEPAPLPGGALRTPVPVGPGPTVSATPFPTRAPAVPPLARPAPAPAAVATASRPSTRVAPTSDLSEAPATGQAPTPGAVAATADLVAEEVEAAETTFVRMLHGDHRAMLAVVDELAGPDADGDARRTWQIEVTALVEATIARTIDLGILHLPLGNPFWDTFTIEQCREIAGSLASMGHRFDGLGGWADDPAPGYRELTIAVADAGIDPRRVRAWPNSSEIHTLYRGVRIAPEDLLAARAPALDAAALRDLLGSRADAFERLWAEWPRIRPLLVSTAVHAAA